MAEKIVYCTFMIPSVIKGVVAAGVIIICILLIPGQINGFRNGSNRKAYDILELIWMFISLIACIYIIIGLLAR